MPRTSRVRPNGRVDVRPQRANLTTEVVTRPVSPVFQPQAQPNRLVEALSAIRPGLSNLLEKQKAEYIKEQQTKGSLDAELNREPPEGSTEWRMQQYVTDKAAVAAREDAGELFQFYETFNPDEWEDPEAALSEAVTNFKREKLGGIQDDEYLEGYVPQFRKAEEAAWQAFYDGEAKRLKEDQMTLGVQLTQNWLSDNGIPTRRKFEQHRASLMRKHGLTREEANNAIIDGVGEMAVRNARPDLLDFTEAKDKDGISLAAVAGVRGRIIQYRNRAEAALAKAQRSLEKRRKEAEQANQEALERDLLRRIYEGEDVRETIANSDLDPSRVQSLLSFSQGWMTKSKSIVDDPEMVSELVNEIHSGAVGVRDLSSALLRSAPEGEGLSYQTYFSLIDMVEDQRRNQSRSNSQFNAYRDMEDFVETSYRVSSSVIHPMQESQLNQRKGHAVAEYQRLALQWMVEHKQEHGTSPSLSSLSAREKLQEIANKAIDSHPPPKSIIGDYYRPVGSSGSQGSPSGMPARYQGVDALKTLMQDRHTGRLSAEEYAHYYNALVNGSTE